jgi:hypothetical protein
LGKSREQLREQRREQLREQLREQWYFNGSHFMGSSEVLDKASTNNSDDTVEPCHLKPIPLYYKR